MKDLHMAKVSGASLDNGPDVGFGKSLLAVGLVGAAAVLLAALVPWKRLGASAGERAVEGGLRLAKAVEDKVGKDNVFLICSVAMLASSSGGKRP